ncbi:MAG: stage V sporulation protein AB [Velocimicrobium sp.]
MLIKNMIACMIGLSGGFIVGAGVFAFITMIGIFPRLADRTNTASRIKLYETAIIWGGSIGNVIIIFNLNCHLGTPILSLFGLFSGIYVGCLAMALAEELKVIPIFVQRAKLKYGIVIVILAIALGKGIGTLYQFW